MESISYVKFSENPERQEHFENRQWKGCGFVATGEQHKKSH